MCTKLGSERIANCKCKHPYEYLESFHEADESKYFSILLQWQGPRSSPQSFLNDCQTSFQFFVCGSNRGCNTEHAPKRLHGGQVGRQAQFHHLLCKSVSNLKRRFFGGAVTNNLYPTHKTSPTHITNTPIHFLQPFQASLELQSSHARTFHQTIPHHNFQHL